MNEEATAKPEGIFYWIALAGLGLNFFGARAYLAQTTLTPQELAELPEERAWRSKVSRPGRLPLMRSVYSVVQLVASCSCFEEPGLYRC